MKYNSTRRNFLKNSSFAGAALLTAPHLNTIELLGGMIQPGVQLYSVRDALANDTKGSVKALAAMGYKRLEGFNLNEGKMFGMPVADFVKLISDHGMKMTSSHCGMTLLDYNAATDTVGDKIKTAIDTAAAQGLSYVVCPWAIEADRLRLPELVKLMGAAGKYAKKAGLRFGYHNHDFEFQVKGPDGRLMIEWFLHEVDPSVLDFEMDIYWVVKAGYQPTDWFRLYPNRWKLCHIKDMAATEKRETVEVGDGTIDFKPILKQSALAGLKHYFIELEHYKTNSMDGVKKCRQNFLKLGL
jgi:sugar phosphate isomerase/epimerase